MVVVLDNIIFSLQRAGGISVYWSELIKRFINRENVYYFESYGKVVDNIFRKSLHIPNEKKIQFGRHVMIFERFVNPVINIESDFVFHSSYYRIVKSGNVQNITTVHDFTYELFRKDMKSKLHKVQKKKAIMKSTGIICVSENTKKDLYRYFPNLDKEVKVIYNGVSEKYKRMNGNFSYKTLELLRELKKPILLFVGSRDKYKNFSLVLESMKFLREYALVIVGGGKLSKSEFSRLSDISNYIHLQDIESEMLNELYNKAFCLLYPSSYEGFGIPIIEAMKAGCPVITTKYSSLPEVGVDAALYLENISVEELIGKVRLLQRASLRQSLISKGLKNANRFSWDKTADETFDFYQYIYQKYINK